jgi:hypothetical protein
MKMKDLASGAGAKPLVDRSSLNNGLSMEATTKTDRRHRSGKSGRDE